MTREERVHYDNGIWLCAAHSPLVDRDWPRYTVDELRRIKRDAEHRAAANLEHAKVWANLEPVLDGEVEWHEPSANEMRPGYVGLRHAVFRIGGHRKQRGRAYIDLDIGEGTPRRTQACIAEGTDLVAHELRYLRPGQPYTVPGFTVITSTSKFWLDRQFIPDHPFGRTSDFTLHPGTYVTDQPFLDRVHRQRLPAGLYKIAVVVILGDTEHERSFISNWRTIRVAR